MNVRLYSENKLMILRFDKSLDFSITRDVCSVCDRLAPGVNLCILDLRKVERVFDSGVALISMLCKRLRQLGAEICFRGMHPDLQRHMSYILPA
jgi:hypothetical protein